MQPFRHLPRRLILDLIEYVKYHGSGLGGPMQAASEDNASIQVLDSQNPGSDGGVSVAESLKVNNCAFKEELEESSSINMAFVPVTLEGSCEDYRPGNNGEAKGDYLH